MTISTPAYEATNEIDTALERQLDMWLQNASIQFRSTLNPTLVAVNPITTLSVTQNFGIVAAGGSQRNFQITVSLSENDASDTGGPVQVD